MGTNTGDSEVDNVIPVRLRAFRTFSDLIASMRATSLGIELPISGPFGRIVSGSIATDCGVSAGGRIDRGPRYAAPCDYSTGGSLDRKGSSSDASSAHAAEETILGVDAQGCLDDWTTVRIESANSRLRRFLLSLGAYTLTLLQYKATF